MRAALGDAVINAVAGVVGVGTDTATDVVAAAVASANLNTRGFVSVTVDRAVVTLARVCSVVVVTTSVVRAVGVSAAILGV
jgi:hypothetical protein